MTTTVLPTPQISIVAPLYNETESFPRLIARLNAVMDTLSLPIEVVLVDDGSRDNTAALMQQLALSDSRYQCVFLSRNYGHQIALTAGIAAACGTEALFIIDGDLQDPPELLTEFYQKYQEGYDVVYAVRKKRKENWFKRTAYALFYRLMRSISYVDLPLDSGDFSLISRRVADVLNQMPEESRFIRGMRSWIGFRQIGVEYERDARLAGESKYSFSMLQRLAYNGIFNFSEYPVKVITRIGMITIGLALLYLIQTLIKRFVFHTVPQGFTALLFVIVLFSGVQLIALGLIGEYVLRIFFQAKGRPLYVVREIIRQQQRQPFPTSRSQNRNDLLIKTGFLTTYPLLPRLLPIVLNSILTAYPDRIHVVIPLFNDWQALGLLLERIRVVCEPDLVERLAFLIVDDCSVTNYETLPMGIGQSLSVLRLYRNVGHQKAIALGVSYLASLPDQYPAIVMDSDGEDRPEDILTLLETGAEQPGRVVFAHRSKRHERFLFRLFYGVYKTVFRLLTGKVITFGNFSLIPAEQVRKLAHVSEIWNNYPGAVIRSRLPYTAAPLERGRRLAGESKMNFVALVLHGLSAISVLMDTTAVRLVLFCVMMVAVSIVGIGVVVALRLLTDTAVPGWASYLVFSFLIVILQAFLISLLLVFIVLSYRTQPQFIPARQFQDFVERVERVY